MKKVMTLAVVCIAAMGFAVPKAEYLPADSDLVFVMNLDCKESPLSKACIAAGVPQSAANDNLPDEFKDALAKAGIDLAKDVKDVTVALQFVDIENEKIEGVIFLGGTFDAKKVFPVIVEKSKGKAKLEGDVVVVTDEKGQQCEIGAYADGLYAVSKAGCTAMKARLAGKAKGLAADSKLGKLLQCTPGQLYIAAAISAEGVAKCKKATPDAESGAPAMGQSFKELTDTALVLKETAAPAFSMVWDLNATSATVAEQMMQNIMGLKMMASMMTGGKKELTKFVNSIKIVNAASVVKVSFVMDVPSIVALVKECEAAKQQSDDMDARIPSASSTTKGTAGACTDGACKANKGASKKAAGK